MLTVTQPIERPGGLLYRDDSDPALVYALPIGLAPATRADGSSELSLLFYQADQSERGARLVGTLAPCYPQLSAAELGEGVRRADLPLVGSTVQLSWPSLDETTALHAVVGPMGRVELSLGREHGSLLHQCLRAGADSVAVRMRAAYEVRREPVAARLRVPLRESAEALREHSEVYTGATLRETIEGLARVVLQADPGAGSFADIAAIVAPYLAARLCLVQDDQPIFADAQLRMRAPEDIAPGELSLDLSQLRSWQDVCELTWSLSDFYRSVAGAPRYFPEVLSLPPVGTVQLLVENLLPVDGKLIDRVTTKVRYRRLGSLEEQVWTGEYSAASPPVLSCAIPRVAFADFAYHYQTSVHAADGVYPREPVWLEGREPILRIEPTLLPFVFGFASAHNQVFAHVARVELEIPGHEARPTLTASNLSCWVALDAQAFRERRLRWRALLYSEHSGGTGVATEWRDEPTLALTVTLADVYPRTPVRLQALASYAELPLVQGAVLELASGGTPEAPRTAASASYTLASDQTVQLTVWPSSVFERGFSYRYGLDTSGREREWTPWQHSTEPRLNMSPADDFYTTRTVRVEVRAPWSERTGPDPTQSAAEVIFAELHLRSLGSDPVDEVTYTFDRTHARQDWVVRSRQRDRRISYDLDVLTLDGRMLKFGPLETSADALGIELYVAKLSDSAPPELGVRAAQ